MTLFMNLDTLPVGKALYTVYVTTDPEGTARSKMSADEVDVVHGNSASWGDICSYGVVNGCPDADARFVMKSMEWYGEDVRVIGVVNQSDGYVVFDAFKAGIEEGADDL